MLVEDDRKITVEFQVFDRDLRYESLLDFLMGEVVGQDGNPEIIHNATDQSLGACTLPGRSDRLIS